MSFDPYAGVLPQTKNKPQRSTAPSTTAAAAQRPLVVLPNSVHLFRQELAAPGQAGSSKVNPSAEAKEHERWEP